MSKIIRVFYTFASFLVVYFCCAMASDNILDDFAKQKSIEIVSKEDYDYERYPWLLEDTFSSTPFEVATLIIKRSIAGQSDFLSMQETFDIPEKENYVSAYFVLDTMIRDGLSLNQAVELSRHNQSLIEYVGEDDIDARLRDAELMLSAGNAEGIIRSLDRKGLLVEFRDYLNKHKTGQELQPPKPVNYKVALTEDSLDQKLRKEFRDLPIENRNTALYGVFSTRQDYLAGEYVNLNGESILIDEVKKALDPWRIFGVKKHRGDMDILDKAMEVRLSNIPSNKEETKVIAFKGKFQDAIIRASSLNLGAIAVVSFANGETVAGGALLGKNGQEESLIHCIPGLYESLLRNSNGDNEGLPKYKSTDLSPEVGLYTEGTILTKRIVNGAFYAVDKPVPVNVIASASVKFPKENNASKISPQEKSLMYDEVRRRIKMQLALAIAKGNSVLVTGLFGCGKYNADKREISKIYQEELQNPLFKDKLKLVVLTYGEEDPYSDFGFSQTNLDKGA